MGAFKRHHGSTVDKTSGTSINVQLLASVPAGNTIVAAFGFDNLTATTPTINSITKPAGETNSWVRLSNPPSPSATAAGAVRGELWAIKTTVVWTTSDVAVATLSAAVAVRTCVASELVATSTTARTTGVGTASGTAVSASAQLNLGGTHYTTVDLVMGFIAQEANAVPTPDSSVDGGRTWQTPAVSVASTGGGSAANVAVMFQVLGNPTATTTNLFYSPQSGGDWSMGIIALTPAAPGPVASLLATAVGPRSIMIEWDGSEGADSYVISRATSSGGTFTNLTTTHVPVDWSAIGTGGRPKAFIDHTCAPNTTYYYKVRPDNAFSAGTLSGEVSATSLSTHTNLFHALDGTPGNNFNPADTTGGNDTFSTSASGMTPTYSSLNAYGGSGTSVEFAQTASGDSYMAGFSDTLDIRTKAYFRGYATAAAATLSDTVLESMRGGTGTSSDIHLNMLGSNYRLITTTLGNADLSPSIGSTNVVLPHRIELEVYHDGANATANLRVFSGANIDGATASSTATLTVPIVPALLVSGPLQFGIDASAGSAKTYYWDEVAYSTDTWIGPKAPAGPQNFTRSKTDSSGIADVGDRITLIKRVATDIGLQGDQDVSFKMVKKAASETEALSDTNFKRTGKGILDLAGLVDSSVRLGLIKRFAGPDILITDTFGYTYTPASVAFTRTPADTMALTDAVLRLSAATRAPSDTEVLTDTVSRLVVLNRTPSDTETLPDVASRLAAYRRAPADLSGLADATTRTASVARTALETALLSDSATRTFVGLRVAQDTLVLTDTSTYLLATVVMRSLTDTEGLSDVAARTVTLLRAALDAEGLTDSVLRTAVTKRSPADTEALTDAIARVHAARRAAADTLAETDVASKALSTIRSTSETALLSDTLTRGLAAIRTALDTEAITDTISSTNAVFINRLIQDALTLVDTVVRQMTTRRAVLDTEALADVIGRMSATKVSKADTEALSDVTTRSAAYKRTPVTDTEALSDTRTRTVVIKRPLNETVGLFDFAAPITALKRVVVDTSALSDTSSRSAVYVRIREDQESLLEAVVSATATNRALEDVQVLVDTAEYGLQRVRGVQDDLVLLENFYVLHQEPISGQGFYVWDPVLSLWIMKSWSVWHEPTQDWVDGLAYTDLNYDNVWESV